MGFLKKAKNLVLLTFAFQAAAGLSHVSAQVVDRQLARAYIEHVHAIQTDENFVEDSALVDLSTRIQQQLKESAKDSLRVGNMKLFASEISLLHSFAAAARDTSLQKQTRTIMDAVKSVNWVKQLYLSEIMVSGALKLSKKEFKNLLQKSAVNDKQYSIQIDYEEISIYAHNTSGNSSFSVIPSDDEHTTSISKSAIIQAVSSQTPSFTAEQRKNLVEFIVSALEDSGYKIK